MNQDVLPGLYPGHPAPAAPVSPKAEAMARVERHASDAWLAAAYAALVTVARRQPELTADDVWRELGQDVPAPHEARAIGPVINRAHKAHVLAATDRVRLSALGGGRWKVRVWRSLVFSITPVVPAEVPRA